MLETGRECISCGEKQFLKDVHQTGVCNECTREAKDQDNINQFNMSLKYKKKDPSIGLCKCHRLYKHRDYYMECEICRSEFGMQEHGEQKNKLIEEELVRKKEIKETEINEMQGIESDTQKIPNSGLEEKKEIKNIELKTKINLLEKSENSEQKTGRSTMQDNENITTEIEDTDLVLSEQEESDETHSTDILCLSSNLRTENSSSINLLTESATLLTTSARKFLKDDCGDFGGEAIRTPTIVEAEMALRLALGANDIMKTKLDYIKTGRNLMNDIYELAGDDE